MESYRVLGLMSGTSLDGVDLAMVHFRRRTDGWKYELEVGETIGYDSRWHRRLQEAVTGSAVDLLVLHNEYGRYLGHLAREFISNKELAEPDFVASHGHTIFHQVDRGLTYQIGSGYHLSLASKCRVVADFRSLDVALGGEGAPLVPVADEYLFPSYDFCLNLGGIANVSFKSEGRRLAFDIGLSNMLLNHLTQAQGIAYDDRGGMARSGQRHDPLYSALNDLPYFRQPSPKSTGYEWFAEEVLPIVGRFGGLSLEDLLCTVTHHVTYQMATSVRAISSSGRMLATGGGAKNDFMIELLRQYVGSDIEVVVPEPLIVDFKEAIAFALMGVLRVRGEVNCLASVTGASRDSSGGLIFDEGRPLSSGS